MAAVSRPSYNEYWVSSQNCHPRNGVKPTMFLLHTQEGAGNADSLARYLSNPNSGVSYHYTISEDYNDHGVTVCDVVPTDEFASWSVLDYNNRAINLCFAGSSVNWTRDQWLQQSRAIDVAAYLAVDDCKRLGIPLVVVPPPYNGTPGISDHGYVTHMGIGTHSDVGRSFPWDVFSAAVGKYAAVSPPQSPTPPPAPLVPPKPAVTPQPPAFQYPSQAEMVTQIWEQLLGPQGKGWPQLGGKTLVDAVASLKKKSGA